MLQASESKPLREAARLDFFSCVASYDWLNTEWQELLAAEDVAPHPTHTSPAGGRRRSDVIAQWKEELHALPQQRTQQLSYIWKRRSGVSQPGAQNKGKAKGNGKQARGSQVLMVTALCVTRIPRAPYRLEARPVVLHGPSSTVGAPTC